MDRFARSLMARVSGSTLALAWLWPGRTDRLIIAPHDLRTADATRAAEIYAGRFVFAGKIVTCHGRCARPTPRSRVPMPVHWWTTGFRIRRRNGA